MATPNVFRTVETLQLDQFKRQFWQWYFIEKKSMPQVKRSFDNLFDRMTKATGVKYDINERQWKTRSLEWMKTWGKTKAQQGKQVAMPDVLKELPLWYIRDRQLIFFHACTREKCNSCESSEKHVGAGRQSNPRFASTPHHCSSCGTLCGVCANDMAVYHQDRTPSYAGSPTTASFSTALNAFDSHSSVSGNIATVYSPQSKQSYPPSVDVQDFYLPQSGFDSGSGSPGSLIIRRPVALTNQSPRTKDTGTMTQASAQSPVASPMTDRARKRPRRRSPEPNVDDEIPHGGYNHFVNWDADRNLFH
ncbi:MAG: hypothetical protein Q9200_002661 [Gallowayella weberi]